MSNPHSLPPGPSPEAVSASDAVVVYDESAGDLTVRPARPGIPRDWPRPQPPSQPERPPNGEK
jgi:hypothetical protein